MNTTDSRTHHKTYHSQPILTFQDKRFLTGYAEIAAHLGPPNAISYIVVNPNWTIDNDRGKWNVTTGPLPLLIPASDVDGSFELIGEHGYKDKTIKMYRRKYLYTGSDTEIIDAFLQSFKACIGQPQ